MMQRQLLVSLVAQLLVGALGSSAAQAAWTTPVIVASGNSSERVDSPRVAIGGEGGAVFVWRLDFDTGASIIEGRIRGGDGHFGDVWNISNTAATTPQLDADSEGNTVVVWQARTSPHPSIRAREITAAGARTPVQIISPSGQDAFQPQVAVNASGKAALTWRRYDGHYWRIQGRTRTANGSLGPVKTLSPAGQNAYTPDVDISAKGKAVFVWERFVPSSKNCCRRVETRALKPDGTLSAVQTLSPPPGPKQAAHDPDVAVDTGGNAVFVWRFEDTSGFHSYTRAQARAERSGALSAVQTLGYDSRIENPQVAVTGPGNAVFAFAHNYYALSGGVIVRARSSSGTLGPSEEVGSDDSDSSASLGLDANGNAVISWVGWGSGPPPDYTAYKNLYVRTRSSSGALGSTEILSTTGDDPDVAVNGSGQAMVAWVDSGPSIQFAAGP